MPISEKRKTLEGIERREFTMPLPGWHTLHLVVDVPASGAGTLPAIALYDSISKSYPERLDKAARALARADVAHQIVGSDTAPQIETYRTLHDKVIAFTLPEASTPAAQLAGLRAVLDGIQRSDAGMDEREKNQLSGMLARIHTEMGLTEGKNAAAVSARRAGESPSR
ncbi:MAG: hypothetical protein KGJ06_04215 [Pseudomonadota bacterium]|nr:hypothetical protein [Pseudomonadota bacterium]